MRKNTYYPKLPTWVMDSEYNLVGLIQDVYNLTNRREIFEMDRYTEVIWYRQWKITLGTIGAVSRYMKNDQRGTDPSSDDHGNRSRSIALLRNLANSMLNVKEEFDLVKEAKRKVLH